MKPLYLLCFVFGTIPHVSFGFEAFLDEPPPYAVATQGDTVLFRCAVGPHVTATVSWKDVKTGVLLTKGPTIDPEKRFEQSIRDRLFLIGDRSNGEYYLEIRNIVGDDSGLYCCHYHDDATGMDHASQVVTLSVMTPPSEGYPICKTLPDTGQFQVGDNITLVCESRGGNPPAALTWIRERDILSQVYTPGRATPLNKVSLVLREQDKDKKFVCLARNPATKQPLSCSLKPLRSSIVVRLSPSTIKADPGADAVYNCITEPIPGLIYTWYVNDQLIDESDRRLTIKRGGKRLKIFPVTRQDDFTLVTCVVEQSKSSTDLMGTASALLWVNLDAVYQATPEPFVPTKEYSRLPDRIYINTPDPDTNEIWTTTPAIHTTLPAGIHSGSNGESGLVDSNGITIDINKLLETLIPPDFLNGTIVEEIEATLPASKGTTTESLGTTPYPETETQTITTESNKLCRGDTCIEETKRPTTTTHRDLENEITNVISENVTPPKENGINIRQLNDSPITSEKESSSGLAVGLSLGLIFLTAIIIIVVIIIWRNRSNNQKEQDKEKQKPLAKSTSTKK